MGKIIIINGVGEHPTNWVNQINAAGILGVNASDIIPFDYNDQFQNHWIYKLLRPWIETRARKYLSDFGGVTAGTIFDYVADVLLYFLPFGIRKGIVRDLVDLVDEYPGCTVIGFSLGSVIAYEALNSRNDWPQPPTLITMGSPLGSVVLGPLIKNRLSFKKDLRPDVKQWLNFYGAFDPISGVVKDLGCRKEDQFHVNCLHVIQDYLRDYKSRLSIQTP